MKTTRVLIVEDDYASLYLMQRILKGKYKIDTSTNSADGFDKTQANNYDVIVMDINLGKGLDGVELTREIRKRAEHSKIPIIAVTAYASDPTRKKSMEAGCNDFITKPINKEKLILLIEKYLQKGRISPMFHD